MNLENLKLLPSLITTISRIDDVLDSIGSQQDRTLIAANLIRSLTQDYPPPIVLNNTSQKVQSRFRKINPKILKPALARLFTDTENLRAIENPDKFAETTAQDGINTAVVLLIFLGLSPEKPIFKPFFTLAAIHKLWDSIFDLKKDAQSGEIKVPPNITTVIALLKQLISVPFTKIGQDV